MTNGETLFAVLNFIVLCVTGWAIFRSPIKAVEVGDSLNEKRAKLNTKHYVFQTLFGYRGAYVSETFVGALNLVEIVFYEDDKVIECLRKYIQTLDHKSPASEDNQTIARINLITQIGVSLGYKQLSQMIVMSPYVPQGYLDNLNMDKQLKTHLLEYLQVGADLQRSLISIYAAQQNVPKQE